jgi:hypothetical protein
MGTWKCLKTLGVEFGSLWRGSGACGSAERFSSAQITPFFGVSVSGAFKSNNAVKPLKEGLLGYLSYQ